MRVLVVLSALSLVTVCALPADNADDFADDQPMSLLQDAQKTVADMKAKGAKETDCRELAKTMCDEVETQQSANQKVLADLETGNQCLNLGQDAVTTAQTELNTKTSELTAAETAHTNAKNTQVAITAPTVGQLVGHTASHGTCVNFFSSGSNFDALKTTMDNAKIAEDVAKGAKTQAEVALQNAITAAAKLKNDCLCQTKATRDVEWARLSAPALQQQQETAKAKCRMMTCVLEGTSTSDNSCKSDLTALTKPTLIDQAEHVSGCTGDANCAQLPLSMNPSTGIKGCPGAVWQNGTPAKKYCQGGSGGTRFPWWAACCVWEETQGKCNPKQGGNVQQGAAGQQIKLQGTNKCIEGKNHGTTSWNSHAWMGGGVHLGDCDSSNTAQLWTYDASAKQLKVQAQISWNSGSQKFGSCLRSNQVRDQGKVSIWTCDESNNQQHWQYTAAKHQIKHIGYSNKNVCLGQSGDTDLELETCEDDDDDQQWIFGSFRV